MKKLLLSAVLVLGMMALTTGCSSMTDGAKKCGASGKCNQGKCGSKSDTKKCGEGKDAHKAADKKCGDGKDAAEKCGAK